VLGHEISHVANGDMVTMSLLQGVLNTFVFVLARVLGGVVDGALGGGRRDDEGRSLGGGFGYFIVVTVLQVLLGFLASLIVMAFSRWREFRADAGGASLAGRNAMIAALQRLSGNHGESTLPEPVQAFGISGAAGLSRLLMSHPPIEERIAALRNAA
jgi:heat shock protein HtpX